MASQLREALATELAKLRTFTGQPELDWEDEISGKLANQFYDHRKVVLCKDPNRRHTVEQVLAPMLGPP